MSTNLILDIEYSFYRSFKSKFRKFRPPIFFKNYISNPNTYYCISIYAKHKNKSDNSRFNCSFNKRTTANDYAKVRNDKESNKSTDKQKLPRNSLKISAIPHLNNIRQGKNIVGDFFEKSE